MGPPSTTAVPSKALSIKSLSRKRTARSGSKRSGNGRRFLRRKIPEGTNAYHTIVVATHPEAPNPEGGLAPRVVAQQRVGKKREVDARLGVHGRCAHEFDVGDVVFCVAVKAGETKESEIRDSSSAISAAPTTWNSISRSSTSRTAATRPPSTSTRPCARTRAPSSRGSGSPRC